MTAAISHADSYAVCRVCGTIWRTPRWTTPRECPEADCDAGWLDIAVFADEKNARRVAAQPDGGFTWPK